MRTVFYSFVLFIAVTGCQNFSSSASAEYASLVKRELAKGVRNDSLFFGIYLGMTSKDFFAHCWEMNKKGVFTDGLNNTAVLYKMPTGLKYPASMNFYPDFVDGKISKMKTLFEYNEWAPWNKTHFADSLLPDVYRLYQSWYPEGNSFITMTDSARGTIYVKVDGNRRIVIGKYDDRMVKVDYTDLIIEEKLKKK